MTKPTTSRRSEMIAIRVTPEQKAELTAKAEAAGKNLSDYVLTRCEGDKPVEDTMNTMQLEERLGFNLGTLDDMVRELDTTDLKAKVAKALGTLDPDGLFWYSEATSKGNVWLNTPTVKAVNLVNRAFRRLLTPIFDELNSEAIVYTTSEISVSKWASSLVPEPFQPSPNPYRHGQTVVGCS